MRTRTLVTFARSAAIDGSILFHIRKLRHLVALELKSKGLTPEESAAHLAVSARCIYRWLEPPIQEEPEQVTRRQLLREIRSTPTGLEAVAIVKTARRRGIPPHHTATLLTAWQKLGLIHHRIESGHPTRYAANSR